MERLTKRLATGAAISKLSQCRNTPLGTQEIIDKLAAYEDAEEQGLLIKLPFKPGDAVWVVEDDVYCKPSVEEYTFMAECMGYAILVIAYDDCVNFKQQMAEMAEDAVYKSFSEIIITPMESVFPTRKEAERILKEVQE